MLLPKKLVTVSRSDDERIRGCAKKNVSTGFSLAKLFERPSQFFLQISNKFSRVPFGNFEEQNMVLETCVIIINYIN